MSKKYHALATILHDGYAAHLSMLQAHGGSRPAQGNARMVIPRGQFGLPGQNASLRRRRWVIYSMMELIYVHTVFDCLHFAMMWEFLR